MKEREKKNQNNSHKKATNVFYQKKNYLEMKRKTVFVDQNRMPRNFLLEKSVIIASSNSKILIQVKLQNHKNIYITWQGKVLKTLT